MNKGRKEGRNESVSYFNKQPMDYNTQLISYCHTHCTSTNVLECTISRRKNFIIIIYYYYLFAIKHTIIKYTCKNYKNRQDNKAFKLH